MNEILIQLILTSLCVVLGFFGVFVIAAMLGWAVGEDMKHYKSGKQYSDSRYYFSLILIVLMLISVSIAIVLQ